MLFDNNFNSFLLGLTSGTIQTIVGHPLDTIKILFQKVNNNLHSRST